MVPPLPMLSAGVALQTELGWNPRWLTHTQLEAQLGSVLEHLGSPPQDLFMFLGLLTEFQEVSLHGITSTTFCHQNISRWTQFREKGKRLSLHDPSQYQIHHIYRGEINQRFYCWGTNSIVYIVPSLSRFNPTRDQRVSAFGSLLLGLLQGRKIVRTSRCSGWILTSRWPRAPLDYLKIRGYVGLKIPVVYNPTGDLPWCI